MKENEGSVTNPLTVTQHPTPIIKQEPGLKSVKRVDFYSATKCRYCFFIKTGSSM